MNGVISGETITGKITSNGTLIGSLSNVSLNPSLETKTITPYTTSKTYRASQGYDYIEEVIVNAISYTETPNEYGTTVIIGEVGE